MEVRFHIFYYYWGKEKSSLHCSFSKVCDDCLDGFSRGNLKECRKYCSSLFKRTRYVFTSSLHGDKASRNDQVGPRDNELYHHL